jgi:hypothetical protein
MSTRSQIAYIDPETDQILSSYCHYDGYLDGVGQELLDNYNSFDRAKELVDGGEMRFPGNYFGKDQNQKLASRFETLLEWTEYGKEAWADYMYIYSEGGWSVIHNNKTKWLAGEVLNVVASC